MLRRKHTFTLLQATQETPSLARLCELANESAARLKCIESLLPAALRTGVKPGPIEENEWCLLLDNNAIAAKVRQLVPALLAQLRTKGWNVTAIRLKVQATRAGQV